MNIDLLPIEGRYRGITRNLGAAKLKALKEYSTFFAVYEHYLDWLSKMDNSFSISVLQMLTELKCEMIRRGVACEIIYYTDIPEEYHFGDGLLGFDVVGNVGESAIQDGNRLDGHLQSTLNENGLFSNHEDAQAFCNHWKKLIARNLSPWEVDENPRPFCVWIDIST